MSKSKLTLSEKLSLFHPYFQKKTMLQKLKFYNVFPEFNQVYNQLRQENNTDQNSNESIPDYIIKTLIYGVEHNIINESNLDDILFSLLEDSLLNSYLFKLDTSSFNLNQSNFSQQLFQSWNIPKQPKILSNIDNSDTHEDFIVCGYRKIEDEQIELLRLLLLDTKVLNTASKRNESKKIIFPTIIDIDFLNELLHIRLRDVDNIVKESPEFSTMSGRIKNTLTFLDHFNPEIKYTPFSKFKNKLFDLEELLLVNKRNIVNEKLSEFTTEIENFTKVICQKYSVPQNNGIAPKDYISNGVMSIIASTLNDSELGDVVGIKFRNSRHEKDLNYAEIKIMDNGDKCISTNNLYWLNLPVLLNRKAIEYLKIQKTLPSGFATVHLEYSLDTANIKILQKSKKKTNENKQATQEKYDDFIKFILPIIKS
ncbi:hypothetical protein [Bacillus cereus group sp. BfR-BA-01026]|uniref:hypothetical protein n=1 Tax=Bacillus cereus group sp. BfR-BA-01026 TaxID=3094872 RepID=UPI0029C4AC56|nr:hypothetical protein [Bacillus cereus group sp. BfR-BA-01026]MDX5914134.1 hypothetical protein [Bacillus cereus group sp. BfR-BA-01026]